MGFSSSGVDKSGDVIKFDLGKGEPEEVYLGHLSMLLDIRLSPDENFIVTADRDEKIRVSRYPNMYNIHNYCLGHQEFVSSIAIIDKILVSGSGDGTIRSWNLLEGKELDKRNCGDDSGVKLDVSKYEDEEAKDDREPLLRRTSVPGVAKVKNFGETLAVTIER